MNREKRKRKRRQFAEGTIFSKMKETKNHLGFHTNNLEEIEVEEKIRNRQKAKEKNRTLHRDKETKVMRLHRGQS